MRCDFRVTAILYTFVLANVMRGGRSRKAVTTVTRNPEAPGKMFLSRGFCFLISPRTKGDGFRAGLFTLGRRLVSQLIDQSFSRYSQGVTGMPRTIIVDPGHDAFGIGPLG